MRAPARTGSVGGTVWFQSERARPVSLAGWSSCCALRVAGRVVWARASRHDTRPRSRGHGARSDYSTRRNNFHPKTQLSWLARLSNTADPEALICGSLCMLVVVDDATLPLGWRQWTERAVADGVGRGPARDPQPQWGSRIQPGPHPDPSPSCLGKVKDMVAAVSAPTRESRPI